MRCFYTALISGFFLLSCSIDQQIDRKEDKIIGLWSVEKVTFKRHGALFKDNVTSNYRDDEFEFLPDYRVIYYDGDLGVEFAGNWEVVAERNYDFDEEDTDIEFYIEMHFYDPIYQDAFGYYGYISRLTRNKFKYHVSETNGELSFFFRKR